MILSTVADRLTAFTVRGCPYRAEAALRASNARNFRTIVSSPHLRLFRDSSIRIRLLVQREKEREIANVTVKRNLKNEKS